MRHLVGLIGFAIFAPCSAGFAQAPRGLALAGQVMDAVSRRPVPAADVRLLSATRGELMRVATDTSGRFAADVGAACADSLVLIVTAPGFQSAQVGLVPSSRCTSEVQVRLTPSAAQLSAVRIVASRSNAPTPDRPAAAGTGAVERTTSAAQALQSPGGLAGDLNAFAGFSPGFVLQMDADGRTAASALGLSATENRSTVQGMATMASEVPPDVPLAVRAATTSFDPAQGRFSGGLIDATIARGRNYSSSQVRVGADVGPAATVGLRQSWPDATLRATGQHSGPLVIDRVFYQSGWQVTQTRKPLTTFETADEDALHRLGILPHMREDVRLATSALGAEWSEVRPTLQSLAASGVARFDAKAGSATDLALTIMGQRSGAQPVGMSFLAAGGSGASVSRNSGSAILQATVSRGRFLNEVALAVAGFHSLQQPELNGPISEIRLVGARDSGLTVGPIISLGGRPIGYHEQLHRSAHGRLQSEWTVAQSHRLKATFDVQTERGRRRHTPNAHGVFGYGSLESYVDGLPATYERETPVGTAGAADRHALSLSIGDRWEASPAIAVQYGARYDLSRLHLAALARRSVASSVFDRSVSPRFGVTAAPSGGVFARWVFHSGVGRFVGQLPLDLAEAASAGGTLRILCVGGAVPHPSTGAPPDSCLPDGHGSRTLTSSVLGGDLLPPSTWRGNLGVEVPIGGRQWLDIRWIGSSTTRLAEGRLLGLPVIASFALPFEGGRPVFVPSGAIDAASGIIANAGPRSDEHITQYSSTVRSRASQAEASWTIGVLGGAFLRFGYTWSQIEDYKSGYSASTAADPRTSEWIPNASPRHLGRGTLILPVGSSVTLNALAEWRSGTSFTPLIDRDINGDGYANDRAFISRTDPDLVPGIRELQARRGRTACLATAAGRVAVAGGCKVPGSLAMDLRLSLAEGGFGLPRSVSMVIEALNVPAAVDRLVHGRSGLRGWGQSPVVDPVLLRVRGFDPAQQRYVYEVNGNFGRDVGYASTRPFMVRMLFRVQLHRSLAEQDFELRRRRAEQPDANTLLARYLARIPDPAGAILQVADSIQLRPDQRDRLADLSQEYYSRAVALWRPLTEVLARSRTPDAALLNRLIAADRVAATVFEDVQRRVVATLDASQVLRVPAGTALLLHPNAVILLGLRR